MQLLTRLRLACSLSGINKDSASLINAFHVFSTHVDNEEYAEITEFLGISKTTGPYETLPKQPVNQAEFNPRRDASPQLPLFSYKTEVCKKQSSCFFMKIWLLSGFVLPFVFIVFFPRISITPPASSSLRFYPPLFSPPISVVFHPIHIGSLSRIIWVVWWF